MLTVEHMPDKQVTSNDGRKNQGRLGERESKLSWMLKKGRVTYWKRREKGILWNM